MFVRNMPLPLEPQYDLPFAPQGAAHACKTLGIPINRIFKRSTESLSLPVYEEQ